MANILANDANVSSKSMSYSWLYPCATDLSFFYYTVIFI